MIRVFQKQLLRLPFAAALLIAVLGTPLDVYAYNQREVGTALASPWLTTTTDAVCRVGRSLATTVKSLFCSPQFWRVALPGAALGLMAAGILPVDHTSPVGFIAGITVSELLEKKKDLVKQADEIRNRVYDAQNGEWRGDDTAKFDGLMDQADTCTKDIERMARVDAASQSIRDAEEGAGRQTRHTPPGQQPLANRQQRAATQPNNADRSLALQGWIMRNNLHTSELVTDRHIEAARRCGVSLDQRSLNIQMAPVALRDASAAGMREWEERLTQVGVVSPDYGGHYTVPDEMMRPLEVAMLAFGGMRQVADIIRTNTGANLPQPTLNDTSNEGALLGEGSEHTELDIDFDQLVLEAYKYTSKRVGMSVEYLQDNAINAAARIGSILGERIGRITNRHFTVGTGSSQPKGIVVAATSSGITTASPTAISYDDIIDLKHSVDPAYRAQGARFMFNDSVLKLLKKIKVPQYSGDTAGMPLWRAGLTVGEPDTIDGDPYTINQHMAAPTASQKAMLYGLLKKYLIRDVRDITLVRLDERYAELGIVAFLAFSRHDGDLLDAGTHPVKYLTMHS